MSSLGKAFGGFFATTFGGGSAAQTTAVSTVQSQLYAQQLQAAVMQQVAANQQNPMLQNAAQIIGGSGYALSTGSIISGLSQAYYQPHKYDPYWQDEYYHERELAIAALAEKVKNG